MTWVQALYDLYEKNIDLAGEVQEVTYKDANKQEIKKELILLPIYHNTAKAQIEVTINEKGDFLTSKVIPKEDAKTILPISEKSDSRASGPVPHPFFDKLKYVAGDYTKYVLVKGEIDGFEKEHFDAYIASLENWCYSEFSHPKALAVYTYLSKRTLMKDLIEQETLKFDKEKGILEKAKINTIEQEESFVRFKVMSRLGNGSESMLNDDTGQYSSEIWKDRTLHASYISYYESTLDESKDLCYLSGEKKYIGELHPRGIRNDGDSAKLFSSNDKTYFTFRGRFKTSNEAYAISFENSHKIHDSLKWIIRKQGYIRDGVCFVVWETNLNPMISPYDDISEYGKNLLAKEADDISLFPDDNNSGEYDTNLITAEKINKALRGYGNVLKLKNKDSNTVIMSLDAATTGRLAVTYFNMLDTSRYLDNLIFWHESGAWRFQKYHDNQVFFYEGMPSFYDIAKALYSTEQEKQLKLKSNSDGKSPMVLQTFNRLLPCVIDRKKLPSDMIKTAVTRASMPQAYEKKANWKWILSIACCLVKKQKYHEKKEVWTMALEQDCTDRSYLYGRLLAVADIIERVSFHENDERQTNAMRYMNAFSQRPFRTWKIIEERLEPYLRKLPVGLGIYFRNILTEINDKFDTKSFSNDSRLDGLYLLGFHHQLNHKKEKIENQEDNKNE
ncbi:MAG: type I-C CRISPR-associated protein Cas8c/Csd1 [Lachnoclostridium sp.]|nr:type I-C CRISPR-associated protein Cas8c/Csd1 [Lachnoclostridium sp.]